MFMSCDKLRKRKNLSNQLFIVSPVVLRSRRIISMLIEVNFSDISLSCPLKQKINALKSGVATLLAVFKKLNKIVFQILQNMYSMKEEQKRRADLIMFIISTTAYTVQHTKRSTQHRNNIVRSKKAHEKPVS